VATPEVAYVSSPGRAFASASKSVNPSRPVKLIVPWSAGGATDVAVRALAAATEKYLGQSITIENQSGAGGTRAVQRMAETASPDGYVIAQIPQAVFRARAMRQTSIDPLNDLTFIIGLTANVYGLAVQAKAPWSGFADLLADARARPGELTYATSGVATTPHLVMNKISLMKGIKWNHVPFRGSGDSMNALLGGHVDMMADGSAWHEMVDAGRLRLLVTWGAERSELWPNVPTLRELGIDLVGNSPYGLAGPRGMNSDVVQKLHDAFRSGMEDPQYLAVLRQLDQKPQYMSSEDYAEYARRESVEQRLLVKELGLAIE
jgi:tripartite-type tricarboxylate transporter receptor subunit TctC